MTAMPTLRRLILAFTCIASAGCQSLLPTSKVEIDSAWQSYDDATQTLTAINPYIATRADVHQQGLDPRHNAAVTLLHFADVLQRFSAAALIAPEDVDRGIRDCLHAGQRCTGYAISVKKLRRDRVGDFWLDSFDFKREVHTTGWSFDALLVFVDDSLVYKLSGGQPTILEDEVHHNPLGPLQGWGEALLGVMR